MDAPPSTARTSLGQAFTSRAHVPERHLVIVHQPGWQAIEDWFDIAERVVKIDPTIVVVVVSANQRSDDTARFAATRPSLVFSPGPLWAFAPLRGRIYHGRPIAKIEQLRRLAEAGVSVPRTTLLGPTTRLDPAVWGEFVVLKPSDIASSSHGDAISLARTAGVEYRRPQDYPEDHPGRRAPMLVQQFIDTGPQVSYYRVGTLFGRPLVSQFGRLIEPRIQLDSADDDALAKVQVAIQSDGDKDRLYVYEADVIALAEAAYRALPEAPLQGCDILRQAGTRRLYVLEVNPGGNTWHFSSDFMAELRQKMGPDYEHMRRHQLDAFGTTAHVLAERTRMEAV